LGIDQPLLVQYGKYLWGVLQFDFGLSTANFPTPCLGADRQRPALDAWA
jgi:ABC-type dipeptide/oligopeptide/nickel transport system permease component